VASCYFVDILRGKVSDLELLTFSHHFLLLIILSNRFCVFSFSIIGIFIIFIIFLLFVFNNLFLRFLSSNFFVKFSLFGSFSNNSHLRELLLLQAFLSIATITKWLIFSSGAVATSAAVLIILTIVSSAIFWKINIIIIIIILLVILFYLSSRISNTLAVAI